MAERPAPGRGNWGDVVAKAAGAAPRATTGTARAMQPEPDEAVPLPVSASSVAVPVKDADATVNRERGHRRWAVHGGDIVRTMARNSLLVLIACCFGLAWFAPDANAQPGLGGQVGTCNSIVAHGAGVIAHINQGIGDEMENCLQAIGGLVEFAQEGCLPPPDGVVPFGSLYIQKIALIAPDTPALQNFCSAVVDTCGVPLLICADE